MHLYPNLLIEGEMITHFKMFLNMLKKIIKLKYKPNSISKTGERKMWRGEQNKETCRKLCETHTTGGRHTRVKGNCPNVAKRINIIMIVNILSLFYIWI